MQGQLKLLQFEGVKKQGCCNARKPVCKKRIRKRPRGAPGFAGQTGLSRALTLANFDGDKRHNRGK